MPTEIEHGLKQVVQSHQGMRCNWKGGRQIVCSPVHPPAAGFLELQLLPESMMNVFDVRGNSRRLQVRV